MPNINLLPKSEGGTKKIGSIIFLLIVGVIWIAVCYAIYSKVEGEIESAKNEYSMKSEEVASLEKELKELNEDLSKVTVEENIVIKRKEISINDNIQVIPEIFTFLLNLPTATPSGAWITKLDTKNEICKIEGYAFLAQDVSGFIKQIRGVDGVSKVKLVETKLELFPNRKIPLQHFQLELTLGGGKGNG